MAVRFDKVGALALTDGSDYLCPTLSNQTQIKCQSLSQRRVDFGMDNLVNLFIWHNMDKLPNCNGSLLIA
ncbi:hypothetical protein B0189_06500 [Moraxella cuniculi]|nr:hypothetical protein B0189_06500 [Moraxella cuniculi]